MATKKFRQKLHSDYRTANKVFWQTIRRLRGKRSKAATFIEDSKGVVLKHQDHILHRWREYFSNLLNPVTVMPAETLGEESQLTEAEITSAIKSLKAG